MTTQYTHLFHFLFENLILFYYLKQIIPLWQTTIKKQLLGLTALFLPIILYTESSIISGTILRLCFRITCYTVFLICNKGLRFRISIYYALICMVLFTANTNIWQTPLLYSISRSLKVFHPSPLLNSLICSSIEYFFCFFLFFCTLKLINLNEIAEVRYHRFTMISVLLICQIYVKSSLKLLNEKNSIVVAEMSVYTIFLQLVLIALIIIYERYLYSRRIEEVSRIQEMSSLYQLNTLRLQQSSAHDIQQLHHNMKNHLLAISNFCQKGKTEQASVYIHSLLDTFVSGEAVIETGNELLNGLFTQKLLDARQNQIEISIIMDGRPISYIHDIDLCMIFGNLMDNAIEACCKITETSNRFISVKGGQINSQYFFCITNSNIIPIKMGQELPLTSKANKALHGYGLRTVNNAIKKYDGTITFDITEDALFKLTVMLPVLG